MSSLYRKKKYSTGNSKSRSRSKSLTKDNHRNYNKRNYNIRKNVKFRTDENMI
jgi:hypothetical protein